MEQYTPLILQRLIELLHTTQSSFIQTKAVGAISSISIGCDFTPFYKQFINDLKHIIVNATTPELVSLRKKSIECIGIVAHSVGAEIFKQDCSDILNVLLRNYLF